MPSRIRPLALAAMMVPGALPVRAAAQQTGPAAVVASLYRYHFANRQNWELTYGRRRALFAPALAALIDADERASAANADEVVGLDFDPLTAAQDVMERFEVGAARIDGAQADVPVTIRMEGSRYVVHVKLARSSAGWRITNIRYPAEQGDLAGILRQLAADRAGAKP
jgi:hypothetical protein